jgi:hypothetical protein
VNEQPESHDIVLEELEQEGRIRLVSYNMRVSDEATIAEVELQHAGRTALGQAEARGAGMAPELLARACLDAVERLLHGRVALRLAGFKQTHVSGEDIVCVLVQEAESRSERLLVGAARQGGDAARAGAYAALDALNRRIGRILASPPRDFEIR